MSCLCSIKSYAAAIFGSLSQGGQLRVSYTESVCPGWDKDLETGLLLAGFTDFHVSKVEGSTTLECSKPQWATGQTSKLGALKPKSSAPVTAGVQLVQAKAAPATFQDLIDEDSLLEGDNAADGAAAGDCSTKRRACKNCSCGFVPPP